MDRLTSVFQEVFDEPDLDIDELSRTNFSAWDSLAQVKLIIGIEEEFNVRFTIDQATSLSSVADLRRFLNEKEVA
jgi:acyl carrier protein